MKIWKVNDEDNNNNDDDNEQLVIRKAFGSGELKIIKNRVFKNNDFVVLFDFNF